MDAIQVGDQRSNIIVHQVRYKYFFFVTRYEKYNKKKNKETIILIVLWLIQCRGDALEFEFVKKIDEVWRRFENPKNPDKRMDTNLKEYAAYDAA